MTKEEAIKQLKKCRSFHNGSYGEAFAMAIKALEQDPCDITSKPKIGRWIKTPKAVMGEGYMWYCDKCEHQVYQDSSKPYPSERFCPNCGQPKMQEVEA